MEVVPLNNGYAVRGEYRPGKTAYVAQCIPHRVIAGYIAKGPAMENLLKRCLKYAANHGLDNDLTQKTSQILAELEQDRLETA